MTQSFDFLVVKCEIAVKFETLALKEFIQFCRDWLFHETQLWIKLEYLKYMHTCIYILILLLFSKKNVQQGC